VITEKYISMKNQVKYGSSGAIWSWFRLIFSLKMIIMVIYCPKIRFANLYKHYSYANLSLLISHEADYIQVNKQQHKIF